MEGVGGGARSGPAGRLAAWRSKRFAELLRRSGQVGNPGALAEESVRASLKAALVAVPLSAAGALLFSPWLALGCTAPLLFYAAPELRLRDQVAARREGVERELPFFSVMVGVMGGAGVPLYSILKGVIRSDVFPAMRKEAQLVRRDVEIFGMNPNDSVDRLAARHPSARLRSFLLGYTSKARSGGDVAAYLTSESGNLLRGLEDGWARYVARVGIVGSMMITMFGVVPLLLMVVGVFSPAFSMLGLVFFTGVGVPVFTMALLFLAGRMQPTPGEPLRGRALKSLAVALPFSAPGYVAGAPWAAAALALFVFFAAYGASVRGQIAEARAMEEGLSKFLRDLLEYKKQEYDLSRAVIAIESQGGHNRAFGTVLSKVAAMLRSGVPLDEVKVECRSALGRLAFLLLGEMSRSGGGTVDTVFQVSSFSDRMIQMRKNAADEVKPYLVLSYVSPLLLAFGVTFVGGVLSSFGSRLSNGVQGVHIGGFHFGAVPPGLSQVSDLLIVVSAASLGLIGAKIMDLTVKNTLRASVNVALAVGAVALMAALGSPSAQGLLHI